MGLLPAIATHALTCAAQSDTLPGSSPYSARHMFTVGTAWQSADAEIAAGRPGESGIGISLEDLDVNDEDLSVYLEYTYRWSPRWALVAGAYRFSDSGRRESSRDFSYDGVDYTTGSIIDARLTVDAYIVDVLYRVYGNDRFEVLAGGGLHALDLSADLRAQVRINETESEFRQSGTTLLAPVPNVRAMALWKPADRIAVRLNAGWLSAEVDDYEGGFTYAHLRAAYELGDHVGVAIGYQWTDIDVTHNRTTIREKYDIALRGPTLTLSYGF